MKIISKTICSIFALLLLSHTCFPQTNDSSDLRNTRWGMTEQDIISTYDSRLRKLQKELNYLDTYVRYIILGYKIEGRNYNVEFQMDKKTQKLVSVFAKYDQQESATSFEPYFYQLEKLLSQKYGLPVHKEEERNKTLTSQRSQWEIGKVIIQLNHIWFTSIDEHVFGILYSPVRIEPNIGGRDGKGIGPGGRTEKERNPPPPPPPPRQPRKKM